MNGNFHLTPFLILTALFAGSPLTAQESVYIETRPKAVIYAVPAKDPVPTDHRTVISLSDAKKTKIRKPERLPVTGLTNTRRTPGYDTYIVQMKGKSYFVPRDAVSDNAFIDGINGEIARKEIELADSVALCDSAHARSYRNLIETTRREARFCEDRARGIAHNPDSILDVHVREFMAADVQKYRTIREHYKEWTESLSQECRSAAEQIALTGTYLLKETTGACHFGLEFTNLSPKTIKTLQWTGRLLDKDGNELRCMVRDRPSFYGHFKGPCPPAWPAEAVWKDIAYNKEGAKMDLKTLTVIYSDDSRLELSGPVLETLKSMPAEVLPSGSHTESHFLDLNQFEIDHNQLLQNKKKIFRSNLPKEKAILEENARSWAALESEIERRGSGDRTMEQLLEDDRFSALLGSGSPGEEAIRKVTESGRALDRAASRNERFRKENFYE